MERNTDIFPRPAWINLGGRIGRKSFNDVTEAIAYCYYHDIDPTKIDYKGKDEALERLEKMKAKKKAK